MTLRGALGSSLASLVLAGCTPVADPSSAAGGAALGPATPWSDPDGRFTVDLAGAPKPRDAQEITAVGTVNYKVYGLDAEPYSFRVAAFAYPTLSGHPLDVAGELGHASGRAVARMRGTVEREADVTVDGVPGKDLYFTVTAPNGTRGRGVHRMLIASPPTRYQAFCLAPASVDFAPCEAFVASLHPKPAASK
ncbi:MAG: hypothetical protein KF819_37875 [Labilithrix sp.]|nr:hypothetical protein [Labilithrix sp.]